MNFDIDKHTILEVLHGSRAYGTFTPESDYDYKGVAIPPKEYFYGFSSVFEQKEEMVAKGHPHDKVIYDLRKFMNLASLANPNILDVLFANDADRVSVNKWGEMLLAERDSFLSKKVRHSFAGYAHQQLSRLKSHRAWILNPPKSKPLRVDFGLPEAGNKVVSSSIVGAFETLKADGYSFGGEVMSAIIKEKQYATALQHWTQYENWKKTRNPVRAAMEAKFSFDGKFALHLIRLGRMCVEILEGKGVIVKRPDAEELLSIRNGAWTYDQLMGEADQLEKRAEELYTVSTLPHHPDMKKLDALCVEIVESFLSENG